MTYLLCLYFGIYGLENNLEHMYTQTDITICNTCTVWSCLRVGQGCTDHVCDMDLHAGTSYIDHTYARYEDRNNATSEQDFWLLQQKKHHLWMWACGPQSKPRLQVACRNWFCTCRSLVSSLHTGSSLGDKMKERTVKSSNRAMCAFPSCRFRTYLCCDTPAWNPPFAVLIMALWMVLCSVATLPKQACQSAFSVTCYCSLEF